MNENRAWVDEPEVMIRAEPESDGRVIDLRLMPWDTVAETEQGRELFRRGAFDGADAELVTVESGRHGGELVGRGLALDERDDAAYLSARISRTRAGDELLELVKDGVLRQASIVFAPRMGGHRKRPDGVTERSRVDLRRVAILERGAYPGAGVLAVRRDPEVDAIEQTTEAPPAPIVDLTPVNDRLERMEARMGAMMTLGHVPEPPAYRATSLAALMTAGLSDRELSRALAGGVLYERALADNLSSENAGLIPPAIIARAATIVAYGRRSIDAVGVDPLPASGMTASWPVLTTTLAGRVGKQVTQKTAVTSAKISFGSGTAAILTFAGASDNALQLIQRSDPPYLELWTRAMLVAWANVTDAQFVADLAAGATGGTVIITGASTAAQIVAALVDASIKVEQGTGVPATAVLVAPDLFAIIAKAYAPTSVNPTSVGGEALASTLRVSVSGLTITNDPQIATMTGIVTNGEACAWLEDGPFTITATDVERLGESRAIWSLGVTAIYAPAGVVKIAIA